MLRGLPVPESKVTPPDLPLVRRGEQPGAIGLFGLENWVHLSNLFLPCFEASP